MASQVYASHGAGPSSPRYSQLTSSADLFSPIHRLSTSTNSSLNPSTHSILTAPPPYDAATTTFLPTLTLQIETPGKPLLSLPSPPRPDPIPISTIPSSSSNSQPTYLSLRPTRSSGSSFLITPTFSPSEEYTPLSTTTYRFGPSRPPIIRLYCPGTAPPTTNPFTSPDYLPPSPSSSSTDLDLTPYDTLTITSPSLLSRNVQFRTRFGTFRWRYASKAERKLLSPVPNSLLVLEKIVKIANSNGKTEEGRTRIAQLARGEGCRSAGSTGSSAGNGGRLEADLRSWEEDADGGKAEREMVVVMIVSTALVMLKKEVDRRRAQQIAVIAAAVSGG